MERSSANPVQWNVEFAKVIGCRQCTTAMDKYLLRDDWENVPQPGYIGIRYEQTRLLLVGQNPAIPPANLSVRDRAYTAALRALRDAPDPNNYAEVRNILDDFIPSWPVRGQYFPLDECNLTLADIAYVNLVRCRTARPTPNGPLENTTPNELVASRCVLTHFEPWLDMLRPAAVVFVGLWACHKASDKCAARGIPSIAVNRSKALMAADRAENRRLVVGFVQANIGSAKVVAGTSVSVSPRHDIRDYGENCNDMNPKYTIELLDELEQRGFTNEAFWRLHHKRDRGVRETISGMKRYCEQTSTFLRNSQNVYVNRRLAYVLNGYRENGLSPGNLTKFIELAEAAYRDIQPSSNR